MDQFCKLKNDDYRRCSCSNRVYDLMETRSTLQSAGEQLTVFNENLDVVGMTAAQAIAMRTASDGENALTADTSASKSLLQAIINSIRGDDASVSGKYSDLNTVNMSMDLNGTSAFSDSGQAIATYNGTELYSAVYSQCRQAVKSDCNDASLQRAITAYLMAIEQDCNTVATALAENQKKMISSARESSAMLDLARAENRKNHNSDNLAQCINNVEAAILSEQVCGAGYHKCLDNGEFIDVTTGAPIAGVTNFYELENLLTFSTGVQVSDQKLSTISNNKTFVQNFEKRVKKFAQPALDKCVEDAETVWSEYLDKALLDIFYAQKSKVAEIKEGCFDFVSACYMNGEKSLTAAMKEIAASSSLVLQPGKVALTDAMCKDYVQSCDNMFAGNIVQQYVDNRKNEDTLTACRAIVKQCFDNFGGGSYENFYYPYSGLFTTGNAPDWFTLYEITDKGNIEIMKDRAGNSIMGRYKSECAKQLTSVQACNDKEIIEKAFGGFDYAMVTKQSNTNTGVTWTYSDPQDVMTHTDGISTGSEIMGKYGLLNESEYTQDKSTFNAIILNHRALRPTGVATEIYNQIVDILAQQCMNIQGRFMEVQRIQDGLYNENDYCESNFSQSANYGNLVIRYGIGLPQITDSNKRDPSNATGKENMCPSNYRLGVDTQSWGACLCWENGGRRSRDGKTAKCVVEIPYNAGDCDYADGTGWCTVNLNDGKVCESAQAGICWIKRDEKGNIIYNGNNLTNGPEPDGMPDGLQ